MHTKPHKLSIAITSALAALSMHTSVMAQEQSQAEDPSVEGLEQITVTAQKRVERISDVPVAVSVLRSEQIESAFSPSLESLQTLVPGMSFRKGSTTSNSAITLRGIGTISFSIAAEPSVSTVVDGVVLGRSGQAFADLYDLQSIEVLRGPQGTLFGKNASAGVVNIVTKRPSYETSGMVEATFFQGNEYRLKGKFEGEIADNAAGSIVMMKSGYDGNLYNVYNNRNTNGYSKEGVRGMLTVEAGADTDLLFIVEHMKSDSDCCADIEALPSGRNTDSEAAPDSDGIVDGVADLDLNQRLIDHDLESHTFDETTGISMQVNRAFGQYDFTSITAYREWENTEIREGDFTSTAGNVPEPVFDAQFMLHDIGTRSWTQFSQELRLASPLDEAFEWQAGAFFWRQEAETDFTREASCQNNDSQLSNDIAYHLQNVVGIDNPTQQQVDDYIVDEGLTCNANDIVSTTAYISTVFDNWAVFGDAKYHLTDDLRLLMGLRYTDDKVSFNHNRYSNDFYGRTGVGVRGARLNTDYEGSTSETDLSGKLGLQYDLTDNSMTYLTYSQGYKGPGFNVFYNMSINDTRPISPETSDAYELGYKYAKGDLMVSAALFQTDIDGFQANNFDCSDGTCITRLTNAGSVSTQGLEMDFTWRVTDSLTLTGGFAKVKAEIEDFFCPEGADCTARSGLDVPFSPDLKYSLSADYVMEMDGFDVLWNANYTYTDEQYSDLPDNEGNFNPASLLPDYGLLNASVAFSFDEDTYRLSLIAKNLTDEKYFSTYSGDDFRYQVARDADRYFGVQFRARF